MPNTVDCMPQSVPINGEAGSVINMSVFQCIILACSHFNVVSNRRRNTRRRKLSYEVFCLHLLDILLFLWFRCIMSSVAGVVLALYTFTCGSPDANRAVANAKRRAMHSLSQ